MPVAYGYARGSTGRQSLTFDVQAKAIERYYEDKLKPIGYQWGGVLEDKATSGTKPFTERPNGLKLWTSCQKGDAVVWLKMDRAFRSVAPSLRALRRAAFVVYIGDPDASWSWRRVFTRLLWARWSR